MARLAGPVKVSMVPGDFERVAQRPPLPPMTEERRKEFADRRMRDWIAYNRFFERR